MANLKETRNRIKSVKSTQKITKAMKMVATAKLKKIRDSLAVLKEYTAEIEYLISATLNCLNEDELKEVSSNPLIAKKHDSNSPYLIVFNTSNKGLCGGINNQNIKHLKSRIQELEAREHKILIYCVGKKGYDYCKAHYSNYLLNTSPIIAEERNGFEAEKVKEEISNIIVTHNVSASSIVFSKFIGTTIQNTSETHLTPVHAHKSTGIHKNQNDYIFDAPKLELIKLLLPEFMLCKVLHTMFENATSEQSARMMAMENATQSASKVIKNLTLIYNRIRQANITREISEIVSGVEALKQV